MRPTLQFTTKLALWSGLLAAAVMLVFVAGLKLAHRQMGLKMVDAQLQRESELFFAEFERAGARADWLTAERLRRIVGDAQGAHFAAEAFFGGRSIAGTRPLPPPTDLASGEHWLTVDGQQWRGFQERRGPVTFRIVTDLAHEREEEAVLNVTLLLSLPLALAAVGLGAWWVARRALRPVREMAVAAGRISASNLGHRLPALPVQDEIGRLARAFNETLQRLQNSFEQAARFSADASHELRTPLAVARATLSELLHAPGLTPEHRGQVGELIEQIARLIDITENLLLLSRADAGRLQLGAEVADAGAIVDELAGDFLPVAEERGLALETRLAHPVQVRAEPWALRIIVVNLLDNAIKYNRSAGRIRLELRPDGPHVSLRVGNTGPAIPPRDAARLFDRFFRGAHTTETRGAGLGLSVAAELARALGGELSLVGSAADWTEFRLTLRPAAAAASLENESGAAAGPERRTVAPAGPAGGAANRETLP